MIRHKRNIQLSNPFVSFDYQIIFKIPHHFLFCILIIVKSKSYCRELFRSFYFGPIFR